MQKENLKQQFENLSSEEKFSYLQKAQYLIEYNYVMEQDIEELAINL